MFQMNCLLITAALLPQISSAAPVEMIDFFSLGVADMDDMEIYGIGAIDSILTNNGVSYGERFVGQSLLSDDRFDVISGTTTGPLTLEAGATNQNLVVIPQSGSQVLLGLSASQGGWPSTNAVGEGSIAILFGHDQFELGFEIKGAGNGGDAFISFFQRDGSLIDSMTVSEVGNGGIAFRRELNTTDIAGLIITNNEGNGFGIDNLKYNSVPAPASLAILGLAALATNSRRR